MRDQMSIYTGVANSLILCVDKKAWHGIRGRVYHAYSEEGIPIGSFEQVIRIADPTGELEFGEEYAIEQLKDGEWIALPGPVEGSEHENYVFKDVAYLIKAGEKNEKEIDWEWIHGPLPPGEYRIKKTIHDFRGTGDFDEYTVYGQFILN